MPEIIPLVEQAADIRTNLQAVEGARYAKDGEPDLGQALEKLLTVAQPRLLRIASLNGVSSDAVDDIVQETLIEAWRSLDHLNAPDRFDAWLDGICRNVCRRWLRARGLTALRETSLSSRFGRGYSQDHTIPEIEVPDTQAFDPAEELDRQDLAVLLDRALGHLSSNAREVLELYYQAELPQREIALRLGLTINALEVRLHRARRQLREVLSGTLRADALEFGLAMNEELATGWRESREWCMLCGQHRLSGLFERMPDGRISLRMRCPGCLLQHDCDIVNTEGLISLEGLHSFRPALKRAMRAATGYWVSAGRQPVCANCQVQVQNPIRIMCSHELGISIPNRLWLVRNCPKCGSVISMAVSPFISNPAVQHFVAQNPRWISEPEMLVEHAGQTVIVVRFVNLATAARLTLLVHSQTLQVINTFLE